MTTKRYPMGQTIWYEKVKIDGHTVQLASDKEGGHVTGYAFSTGKYYSDPLESLPVNYKPVKMGKTKEQIADELESIRDYQTLAMPTRHLRREALERFGVRTAVSEEDGETITSVHFPYSKAGDVSSFKTVLTSVKKMWWVGSGKEALPFGWQQAVEAGSPKLFITEGEYDAVAVYQMLKDNTKGGKWEHLEPAVVSIKDGAGSAVKFLSSHANLISKHFKDVVLVFDMDEPGQEAAKAVSMIMPGAKVASLPAKDANACLIEGRSKAFCNAVLWNAAKTKNTRTVSVDTLFEKARVPAEMGLSWPWEKMTGLTRGIRFGETIYITGTAKIGKCMSPDTLVRLFGGGVATIGSLSVGDTLLGRDSKPRTVLATHRGSDFMYKVSQTSGNSYTVNSKHDIVMQKIGGREGLFSPEQVMTSKNRDWAGIHSAVEYDSQPVEIEAYKMGVWLGDGSRDSPRFCLNKEDSYSILRKCGEVSCHSKRGDKPNSVDGSFLGIAKEIRSFNREKFIKDAYLINSRETRLSLLAGWIDTDGHKRAPNGYEIVTKDEGLADTGYLLLRSLGFKVSVKKVSKGIASTGFVGEYYRINFSGDLRSCPIQVERKQCSSAPYKDPKRTGLSVEEVGLGEYVGIEVDGDRTYLLEDYTVVHNSDVLNTIVAHLVKEHGIKCFVCKPEEANIKSVKMIAGKLVGKVFHDPLIPFDNEAYDEAIEIMRSKVELVNIFQNVEWETLKGDITAAAIDGCKAVFIDPLTVLTTGMSSSDANVKLQEISQNLSSLALDLDIVIFIFTHLKNPRQGDAYDRGGKINVGDITGSRGMTRSCNLIIGIQGNNDPELKDRERNLRDLVLLADREHGAAGVVHLWWDKMTSWFTELKK